MTADSAVMTADEPCRKQTWSSGNRSKRNDPDASYNPPIKTRTWENQADEVMSDGATTEKFRSLAVYADIKLQEALEKCNVITPAHVRDENTPDRFRSACCLQVQPYSTMLSCWPHPPSPVQDIRYVAAIGDGAGAGDADADGDGDGDGDGAVMVMVMVMVIQQWYF